MCDNPGNLSSPKITKKKKWAGKATSMQLPPFEYHHPEAKPRNPGNPETHHVPYKKPSRLFLKPRHPCEGCMIWLCQSTWLANSWRFLNHWVMQAKRKKYMSRWSPSGLQSSSPPSAKQKQKKIPAAISCSLLVSYIGSYNYTHIWQLQRLKCVCVCVCVFVCIFGAPKE